MSKGLSPETVEFIQEAAEKINYGSIQINLSETGDYDEVIVTERTRFRKEKPPKPGQIVRSVIRRDAT